MVTLRKSEVIQNTVYKKSELMLTGRAKAYSSSVRKLSVYLQPFRRDFYAGTAL